MSHHADTPAGFDSLKCVAVVGANSREHSSSCSRSASEVVGGSIPLCRSHASIFDPGSVDQAFEDALIHQARIIRDLEDDLREARGAGAEWRRLAKRKHGEVAAEYFSPVLADESHVYFIQSGEYVKIGKADNPASRVEQLRLGGVIAPPGLDFGSLALLATELGGLPRELELHKKFEHLREVGEWFRADAELLGYIDSLSPVGTYRGI